MFRSWLLSTCVSLLLGALLFLFGSHMAAARFHPWCVHQGESSNPRWTLAPSPLPRALLQQEFTYLGQGAQCYAFVSQDGQYVLKLFKNRKLQSIFPWIDQRRQARKERLFASCLLAFQELKEETGLLYMHLYRTEEWNQEVCVRDKLGRKFSLALDELSFFIQKRARMPLALSEEERAKIASLIAARDAKGITDEDCVLEKNIGFLGEQPLFIDIGQFSKHA